jgi:hypothetical protein
VSNNTALICLPFLDLINKFPNLISLQIKGEIAFRMNDDEVIKFDPSCVKLTHLSIEVGPFDYSEMDFAFLLPFAQVEGLTSFKLHLENSASFTPQQISYIAKLRQITHLHLEGGFICEDEEDLEAYGQLGSLDLKEFSVHSWNTDTWSFLVPLINLKELVIYNLSRPLTQDDYSYLAQLSSLKSLVLNIYKNRNLKGIEQVKSLKILEKFELKVDHGDYEEDVSRESLQAIATLDELTDLTLQMNDAQPLEEIDTFNALKKLRKFVLKIKDAETIGPKFFKVIATIQGLKTLRLELVKPDALEGVESLNDLKELKEFELAIKEVRFKDKGISSEIFQALATMEKKLTKLEIIAQENPFKDKKAVKLSCPLSLTIRNKLTKQDLEILSGYTSLTKLELVDSYERIGSIMRFAKKLKNLRDFLMIINVPNAEKFSQSKVALDKFLKNSKDLTRIRPLIYFVTGFFTRGEGPTVHEERYQIPERLPQSRLDVNFMIDASDDFM